MSNDHEPTSKNAASLQNAAATAELRSITRTKHYLPLIIVECNLLPD